jgi:hypothetical protein
VNIEGDINEASLLQENSPLDRHKSRTLKAAEKLGNLYVGNFKQVQTTLHEKSPPNKNKKKIVFQFDED